MKILAIFLVPVICSMPLAHSTSGRQQKQNQQWIPLKPHYHSFPSPGPVGKEFQGIRTKPKIPYVDEESNVGNGQSSHHFSEEQLGRQVRPDPRGRHVGVEQKGRHEEVVQRGRHTGAEQQGQHVEEAREERLVGVVRQNHPVKSVQQGRHVGPETKEVQRGRQVGTEHQGNPINERHVKGEGRERNPRGEHVGSDHPARHVGGENLSRQTRQSLLTVNVPTLGNLLGGNHGSALQQDTTLAFPPGTVNHPGNTGSNVPGNVIILHPGSSSGIDNFGSIFRPESTGSFGQNGNSPFIPVTPTHVTSSAGSPGGSANEGLAGGLGGAYGGGYGLGFGGLIFGGPRGPVFAGNTGLNEGFRGNPDGRIANSNLDQRFRQNGSDQKERTPTSSRGNSFHESTKSAENTHGARGVTDSFKPHYPNNNSGTSSSSNGGETVGYVAFIFPKRNLHTKATEPSNNYNPVKSHQDAATFQTNAAVNQATPVNNRPAPTYVAVPVHIPVDRPYPVLVPKPYPVEVLKPYPVAVPVREPYEVTRHIQVPLAVPAGISRPSELPVFVGYNGAGSTALQPSILHKRSDTTAAGKTE